MNEFTKFIVTKSTVFLQDTKVFLGKL